ncbi:unnamed protein product [Phytophthora lilii]|uniref:Unnamed protein product n=1 Tax=Phytophthora lilii TaxID=2077276 RepID=A0A9W6WZ72_9STRA|nr:unnamed protein product [Phytophthora lilii]
MVLLRFKFLGKKVVYTSSNVSFHPRAAAFHANAQQESCAASLLLRVSGHTLGPLGEPASAIQGGVAAFEVNSHEGRERTEHLDKLALVDVKAVAAHLQSQNNT